MALVSGRHAVGEGRTDGAVAAPGGARPFLRTVLPYAGAVLALALFAAAAFILYREVSAYRPSDVRRALAALGPTQVVAALGITAASYLLLTAYDMLALKHVGWQLRYARIALTSFVAYAFSHTFGFGSIVGTSVRYRLYGPLGLTAGEVAEVSAFVNISFIAGLAVAFPAVLLLDPRALAMLHVPAAVSIACAAVGALLALGYVLLGWWIGRPLCVFGYELDLPRPRLAVAQIALSLADLVVASAVLYMCLPVGTLPYSLLLGTFVLALVAGLISHVPGGLGVFDTIILLGLSDRLPGDAVLAGLLVFRLSYFLLPVILAGVLFGAAEAVAARGPAQPAAEGAATFVTPAAPLVLAGGIFLGGVVLLFSSAAPADAARLWLAGKLLPLPLLEASHFVGSIVGMLLLLLARGLQRRLHAAWVMAAGLLAVGSVSSLLRGLDWPAAAVLAVLLLALLPARREFNRRSSFGADRFTPAWFLAISTVLLSALWLGLFCYRHDDLTGEVWWRFALHGDASRFLRASIAVAVVAFAAALFRLLAPIAHRAGHAERRGRGAAEDL